MDNRTASVRSNLLEEYSAKFARSEALYREASELLPSGVTHGALLLGHGRSEITQAITEQLSRGTHYGACHELEIEWARMITELVPCAEKVRFTASGTEATLLAMRVARAFTGRNKILKFISH